MYLLYSLYSCTLSSLSLSTLHILWIYHTQNNEKLVSFYINNDDNGYKWCTSTKKIAFLEILKIVHTCVTMYCTLNSVSLYIIYKMYERIFFVLYYIVYQECPSIFCLICLKASKRYCFVAVSFCASSQYLVCFLVEW